MGKIPKRKYRRLYVGEWIAACGYDQADAVKATGYSQSYLSNLSGPADRRKENPSADFLLKLSEFLQITVNDLYRAPPPPAQMAALRGFSTGAQAIILRGSKVGD